MKYIVVLVIIAVSLYTGRNYIKGWIIQFRDRNKKNITGPKEVNTDLVYVPVMSSRTFYFAIEIKELGGGKATLTVLKPQGLD